MVLALLALPGGALAAAPANDDFADRQVLSPGFPGDEPVEITASNIEATKEDGEFIPGLAPAGHSVWFEWEAASDGWVTIGACDNQFPTVLAVFTGTAVDSLTSVANGNGSEGPDCPYQGRQYSFPSTSGIKYVIAVDGNIFHLPESPPPVTEGEIELQIKETPVPPNDEFENATEMVGQIFEEPGGDRTFFASVRGFNWTASIDHGEPQELTSGASVWYSLTAPEDGTYNFSSPCCQAAFQLVLDIYRGDAIKKLTPVAVGEKFPEVDLAAGETVRIRVAGPYDEVTEQPAVAGFDFNVGAILPKPDTQTPNPFEAWSQPPDITAPQTTIKKTVLKRLPPVFVFKFGSSEPGSSFRCSFDQQKFKPCGHGKRFGRPMPGRHRLRVVAVDPAGNVDSTPAIGHFRFPKHQGREPVA